MSTPSGCTDDPLKIFVSHRISELSDQVLAAARLWSELNLKDRESVIRHMLGLRRMEEEAENVNASVDSSAAS